MDNIQSGHAVVECDVLVIGGGTGNPIVDNITTIGMSGFSVAYAVAAFIFMILPQTGKAIARYHGKEDGPLQDRPEDLYDEDQERIRRALQPPGGG